LGGSLTAAQVEDAFAQELTLRRLANLPPFGRLYLLRLRGSDAKAVIRASKELRSSIGEDSIEGGIWLSKPYARGGEVLATGYTVGVQVEHALLQRLRSQLWRQRVSLSINCSWGPWL